ncbi:methyltransferase [Rhizobium sp. CG5]|nr:50S ribosomal protein L11 methyltransferase [Rhizobium sp. CG5]MCM2472040.1 methyltransferase [Rhizobium sp. CG5]
MIRDRLTLQPPPGLAGTGLCDLKLYRAGPSSGLSKLVGSVAPYWAHPWAGGLALARYMAERPDAVAGRHVLDLGTGGGLVAIAAALMGAASVTGIDIDAWAISAARLNADANGVGARFLQGDVADVALAGVDMILVGDLFYDKDLADTVSVVLASAVSRGIPVLVGDPGRKPLPRVHLLDVVEYPVADVGDPPGTASATGRVSRWV